MSTVRMEFTQADANALAEKVKLKAQAFISGDLVVEAKSDQAIDMITLSLTRQIEATNVGAINFTTPRNWLHALASSLSTLPLLGWIPWKYHTQCYRVYKTVVGDKYVILRDYSSETG